MTGKYTVEVADEFSGFIDYYQGHGHAFTKDPPEGPVACVTLQAYPGGSTTWSEIGDALLEDQSEFDRLGTFDEEAAEEAVKEFIKKEYCEGEDAKAVPYPDWEPDDTGDASPTYLVVLHVYGPKPSEPPQAELDAADAQAQEEEARSK
jgi:hypothetical protein